MSGQAFDDVLRRARKLSPEQQRKLIEELTSAASPEDSSAPHGKTVGEALRERGLLGAMKDAPPDLGTNPKYMEGFGEHRE